MKPLTFISLFAGIGGFDLGLERAGMKCIAQVEIDPYCRAVLAKHWPDVPRFEDVREVGAHNLPAADLICGGFPCQDISNAGKRAGINGERSGLWSEYARIIRELQPAYVVVENVAALLVRGMGTVLGDLAACGFDAQWRMYQASDFGAPHRRQRVFIVAHADQDTDFDFRAANPERGDAEDFSWWRGRLDELGAGDGIERCDSYAGIRRTLDGIPNWTHRLGTLGNAVVPQVAEVIGRAIVEAHSRSEAA